MGCAVWVFSLVAVSGDLSLVAAHRLRFAVASPVAEDGLQGSEPPGSRAQAPRMWPMGLAASQHVGSSWIWDQTCVSCISRWTLYH